MVRRIAAIHRCPRSALRERGSGCDQSEQAGQYREMRRCRHSRTCMLGVLARFALCGTTPACHGRWRLAVRWRTQEEIVVTNRRWNARAQCLLPLRCRRRFEQLVRCGARIVPDAIEFRDQVDGLSRRGRSWIPTCPLARLWAVVGLSGRSSARSLRATCLLITFSTTVPQALRVALYAPY